MYKKILLCAAAGAAVAIAGTASATSLKFSYYGGYEFLVAVGANWTQSSTPNPISYDTGSDTDVAASGGDVLLFLGFLPFDPGSISSVEFNSAANGGGFSDGSLVSVSGPQIYTGTEANPVFTPGVYDFSDGVLTISDVPEPTTWTMMILGIGGVGAMMRRRKTQSLAA